MLVDKTEVGNSIVYYYRANGFFYNSQPLPKNFLIQFRVPSSNIAYEDSKPNNTIPYSVKFDVMISLLTWGSHDLLNIYSDQVGKLLDNNGILIIDIREVS